MKKTILAVIIYCGLSCTPWSSLRAQTSNENSRLFRFYEDNDFINLNGNGTDQAYTNGTRFDLFYTRSKPPRGFPDRWMPRAGKESINTYGWGFMQVMFTPRDLWRTKPLPGDFSYSGGLFITHTIHSSNPLRKYNVQTEWFAGVMGPLAMARETQTAAHYLLGYTKPRGWDYQLGNKLLLNINLTAEKQLLEHRKWMEVMAGGQLYAGTMLNGASVYSLIRIGKMSPYFSGYFSQYTAPTQQRRPWQLYFTLRPNAEFMLTNALVKGVPMPENLPEPRKAPGQPTFSNHKLLAGLDVGLGAAYRNMGFSFSQKTLTPLINGLSHHEVGNISFYIAW